MPKNPYSKAKKGETAAQRKERQKNYYHYQRKDAEARSDTDAGAADTARKIHAKLGDREGAKEFFNRAQTAGLGPLRGPARMAGTVLDAVPEVAGYVSAMEGAGLAGGLVKSAMGKGVSAARGALAKWGTGAARSGVAAEAAAKPAPQSAPQAAPAKMEQAPLPPGAQTLEMPAEVKAATAVNKAAKTATTKSSKTSVKVGDKPAVTAESSSPKNAAADKPKRGRPRKTPQTPAPVKYQDAAHEAYETENMDALKTKDDILTFQNRYTRLVKRPDGSTAREVIPKAELQPPTPQPAPAPAPKGNVYLPPVQ